MPLLTLNVPVVLSNESVSSTLVKRPFLTRIHCILLKVGRKEFHDNEVDIQDNINVPPPRRPWFDPVVKFYPEVKLRRRRGRDFSGVEWMHDTFLTFVSPGCWCLRRPDQFVQPSRSFRGCPHDASDRIGRKEWRELHVLVQTVVEAHSLKHSRSIWVYVDRDIMSVTTF